MGKSQIPMPGDPGDHGYRRVELRVEKHQVPVLRRRIHRVQLTFSGTKGVPKP